MSKNKSLVVVFEHTKNFSAKLIQFWMIIDSLKKFKKPTFTYNHSYVMYDGYIYEAIDDGVKRRTLAEHLSDKKYKKKFYTKTFVVPITSENHKELFDYLENQKEKKYEFLNFLYHPLKTILGVWVGSQSDKKLYCHELSIRALNIIDTDIDPFLNPTEFYDYMVKKYNRFIIN